MDPAQTPDPQPAQETEQADKRPTYQIVAELIKTILQGCIAIGILVLLGAKLFYHIGQSFNFIIFHVPQYMITILRLPALDLVAKALAYAAGVDLAYMLLTPGPDEAIEPLILGLASAILFSMSNIGATNLELAKEIGLYTFILSFLFLMKAVFIPVEENKPQQHLIATLTTRFDYLFKGLKKWLSIK